MLHRIVLAVQAVTLAAVVAFGVLLFTNEPDTGPAVASPAGDTVGSASDPAAASNGVDRAAIFRTRCAGCHGAAGEGGFGPRLAGGRVVERFPDPADQLAVITDGQGSMPAFGKRLTADELEAVVAYTRDDLSRAAGG